MAHVVYLAAFMPASSTPSAARQEYSSTAPENAGELISGLLQADPLVIGALRLDPGSNNPTYRSGLRRTFFGDVEPTIADAGIGIVDAGLYRAKSRRRNVADS